MTLLLRLCLLACMRYPSRLESFTYVTYDIEEESPVWEHSQETAFLSITRYPLLLA